MNKEETQFVIEGITKAFVSFIPGIGGAVGSILSDALADRKEQRLKEFLNALKTEVEEHRSLVNKEFVSKGDFLDIFEATAAKIANERSEEKRVAFRKILVKSIFSQNVTYDEVEYQMRILDQLNGDHIVLLKLFHSPEDFARSEHSKYQANTYLRLFRQLLPNWEYDYLFDHLHDLENYRIIESITTNLQTMMTAVTLDDLKGQLTSKGASFVSFIIG